MTDVKTLPKQQPSLYAEAAAKAETIAAAKSGLPVSFVEFIGKVKGYISANSDVANAFYCKELGAIRLELKKEQQIVHVPLANVSCFILA